MGEGEGQHSIVHRGLDDFRRGQFEDGGSNLYVNAHGIIETIHRTDVNNDGYIDIVFPNHHGYTERGPTWVYRVGEGEAANWERQELPNDSGWMSRVADVDGDGYLDLVVVNGENGVTSELDSYIYWGGPSGLTGERTEFSTAGAYDVAIVDVNGNGRLDLIFPSAWVDHHNEGRPRPLQVFLQRANRQFDEATHDYGLIGVASIALAAGDLNGNGCLDLVVGNYYCEYDTDTESFVYWGKPGGGFDVGNPLRLPTRGARQVLLADLNGDGLDEIVFAGGDEVRIYWNDSGRFSPDRCRVIPIEGSTSQFARGWVHVALADVDGDGHDELIVAGVAGVHIRSLDDLDTTQTFLPLPLANWVSVADLDGDGRPELIVSRYADELSYDTTSAIFWNGPAGFSADHVGWVPTGGAVGNLCADLDGDGRPEVVFNNTMRGPYTLNREFQAYVYLGNENAGYGVDRRLELTTGPSCAYVLADLNLDGHPDLVFTTHDGLRIFPGGAGGPSSERFVDLPTPLVHVQCVLVADFNRDGYLDLLALATTYDDKPETMAHSTTIFYGSPDGFSPDRAANLPTFSFGMGNVADVNRDGYLDVIVGDHRGGVMIYLGGPDGYSPERRMLIPIDTGWVGSITPADINGDGWMDLIVTIMGHYTRQPSSFQIFYGGPEGYSQKRSQFYAGNYSPGAIAVADLNNNGHLDLLVPAYSSARTRVLPAQVFWGGGERIDIEHPLDLPAQSSCSALLMDFNRNGWIDVALACHRDDVGHQADALIYWNGPDGLSPARTTPLPVMGPHYLSHRDPGNAYNRGPTESYTSPAIDLEGSIPTRLCWEAEASADTSLKFQVRRAESEQALEGATWQGLAGAGTYFDRSGDSIAAGSPGEGWLQYRALFVSPYGCSSPRLTEVRIDLT